MNLGELNIGARAKVVAVAGEDQVASRLFEMGVTPGSLTTVIGVAPLGDPIEIEIRHYRLSLRRTEAERITIERID